jgi:capsular exopolysaccharide synthesis family protein
VSQNNKSSITPSADEEVLDLGALLGALWRNKLWICTSILVFVAMGAFYAIGVATPKYRATSVILLDTSGQQLVDLSAVLPSLGTNSETINTQVEILQSRRLLERVVNAADLTEDPEFNSSLRPLGLKAKLKNALTGSIPEEASEQRQITAAINAVLARVSVRNIPNTYVLQVTMQTESAQKSAHLADTIAEQYILYQMDVKFEAARVASEWLTSRVADLKLELEQAEARVSEFSTNSAAVSMESVQGLDRQLKELRDRLTTTRASFQSAEQELAVLEALKGASAPEKADKANDTWLTALLREGAVAAEFDARFEQLLARAKMQAERAGSQVQSLALSIASREAQIAKQSDEIIQLQQLSREAEASRLLYEHFLGRLKETSAQEGIQQADGRILSNAVLPGEASEPRKSLIIAVSLILGAVFGSCGALLWEMRQNGYRQARDLEVDTGLIVMGQIPLLPTENRRQGLDYLANKPTSAAAEAVRNLRTSVLLSGLDKTPKVIMTTSSLPAEGKTTISFALAQNLVGLGKKVLLVEGDIRRPVASEYLNVKNAKGLMSILLNETSLEEAVIRDTILGADILVSETSKVNAADILSSQRFVEFLETARNAYDFVFIDTPPVLVVPDARVVAQHADMVLFTVQWDKTTKAQVRDALRMFETVGIVINGVVLNRIDPKGMKRYGYGDSYGAYGSKYYID